MKLLKSILIVGLVVVSATGLIWVARKYLVSRQPSGEPYQLVPTWPRLPTGTKIGQVSGVGVDSRGDVYVFHRADRVWAGEELTLDLIQSPTIFILDARTGSVIDSWGANMFVMPHGLTIDEEDNLWLTDVGLHQVFKFDRAGNLLMTLGERGGSGQDDAHFNQPTDVAVAPDGSFYVSDGYGNTRVMKFSREGKLLSSWGMPGSLVGQFDTPHSIALDSDGHVYVADRGNARVQIFDADGNLLDEWKGSTLGRPWAIRFDAKGNVYIVDGGDQSNFWPDRARILKLDAEGQVLASFGSYGGEPGQFIWPHTIAIGPDGALYVGEVSTGMRIQKFMP
jgi:peptidylamidoglycolate lyase